MVQNFLLERGDKPVKGGVDVEMGGGGGCHFFIYNCTFLIHYGSVQKMLTVSFNFVWNTQKNKWAIFFECPGNMFLSIEKVFKKISEDQP